VHLTEFVDRLNVEEARADAKKTLDVSKGADGGDRMLVGIFSARGKMFLPQVVKFRASDEKKAVVTLLS